MGRQVQYNWNQIRDEYLSGKSFSQISRDHGGRPTVSAITKQAQKMGWGTPRQLSRKPQETRVRQRDNPEIRQKILDALADGATYEVAAGIVGITRQTLTEWRSRDIAFQTACNQARAKLPLAALNTVSRAITQNDDVHTSKWLLERSKLTRDEFRVAAQNEGGGLAITINIPRTEAEARTVSNLLEHQADGE